MEVAKVFAQYIKARKRAGNPVDIEQLLSSLREPEKGEDGQDGNTPVKGRDYFTEAEIDQIRTDIQVVLFEQVYKEVATLKPSLVPIKGKDYFTEAEQASLLVKATPVKGVHYRDGKDGKGEKGDPGEPGQPGAVTTIIKEQNLTGEQIARRLEGIVDPKRKLSATALKDLFIPSGGGGGASGTTNFIDLADAPTSYSGSAGLFVRVKASEDGLEFATEAGLGDVTGAASSTDNAIARFDGLTGKVIQNSGASIDDLGNISANNLSGINTGDQDLSGYATTASLGDLAFLDTISSALVVDFNEAAQDAVGSILTNKFTYNDSAPSIDINEANLTLSNIGGQVTDAQVPNTITLDNITQITNRSHTDLSNIGTNTHAQIDTHIASTTNPHSTTLEQARSANNQISGDINANTNKIIK